MVETPAFSTSDIRLLSAALSSAPSADIAMSLEAPSKPMSNEGHILQDLGVHAATRQQWENLKPLIKQIYIEENKPFPHLAEMLRKDHGFEPTKRQFDRKIKLWGFSKNIPRRERRVILQTVFRTPGEEAQGLTDRRLKPGKLINWRRRYRDELQLDTYLLDPAGGHIQGTPSLASNNVSVISNCKSDVPYDNVSTTKSLHDLNEDRDNDPGETAFPEMHQNTSPFEWSRFEELSVPELVPLLTALRLEATSTEQPPFPDESEAEDSEYLLNSELQDMSKNGSVSGIDNIDLCLTLCNNSIQDTNQEALNNTPQYPWRDPENVFMGTTISPLNEIYVFPPSQVLPRTRKSNVVDLWSCLSAEASKLEVKLGKLETQFGNHNPAVIAVMEQLSSIYCRLDDLRQAERLKQRLADIYCQTFGSNNVRTLQAALSVVEILVEQGQLLKAEALSHGLRSSISELVEQTHPLAISANFIYARICDYFGRSEEAERCFRQHLQVMLSLHGPKALSTIRATAALGAGIDEKRASKEKEILLRIAAQLVVELPPVDESPFPVYRTIISQLHTLGLYEECYQIATRVLERFSLPLGDQHPTIWKARDQLAWGMGAVGRHRESIKLFRAVITHQEETAGNIDGYFVNTWSGLANTLFDSGESDEAMIRYERAFKARLDLYGASNKFTISIAYHLGWFYYDRSRYMEALDVYNKMVHMLCESGNQEVAMLKFKSHALYIKMLIGQGTGGNLQGKFEAATVEAKSV